MGSFSELSIGDVLRTLGRYRPVVVSVLAILLALAVLPKPDRPAGLASTGLGGSSISTPTTVAAADGSSSSAGDGVSAPSDAGTSFSSPPVTSGSVTFSPGSSFTTPTSFPSGSGSGSSSSEPSGEIGPVTSGTSTVDTTSGPVQPKPLQVVGKLWAGRTGGTPVGKDGVPDGTLPIGARVQDDRISFVKLAGDGTALGFAEDLPSKRDTNGPAKVQACKATEAWSDAEAVPLQDAPAYDANRCVQGTASASGVWVFDLSSFSDRTDAFGFALVPGDGAGLEWQVNFRL